MDHIMSLSTNRDVLHPIYQRSLRKGQTNSHLLNADPRHFPKYQHSPAASTTSVPAPTTSMTVRSHDQFA